MHESFKAAEWAGFREHDLTVFGSQVSSGGMTRGPCSSFKTPCVEPCCVCRGGDDRDHGAVMTLHSLWQWFICNMLEDPLGATVACRFWFPSSGAGGTPTYKSTANGIQSGGTAQTIHPTSSSFMDEECKP